MRRRLPALLLTLLLAGAIPAAGAPGASDRLRETAARLLATGSAEDAGRAADLLLKASDIDAHDAATLKAQAEARKLAEPEGWKVLVDITPFLSFVIVALGFFHNSRQARIADKDKREEAARQRAADAEKAAREQQAAEEARWTGAVSLIQKTEEFSPAAALLSTFQSGPHAALARQTALSLMLAAKKFSNFTDLFNTFCEPVTPANLHQVLDLLRSVSITVAPLLYKAWADDAPKLDALSPAEHDAYDLLTRERSFLGAKAAAVLRQRRAPGDKVDLSDIGLDGVDLSGADLRGATAPRTWNMVNLDGADLRGMTGVDNTWVYNTAWWHASRIDAGFLALLEARSPWKDGQFSNTPRGISQEDYRRGVARLRGESVDDAQAAGGTAAPA